MVEIATNVALTIPGGPPGGPLRVLTSYFCRGLTHEIIIYNRNISFEIGNVGSITFLLERSVLCFLLSEDENLCLSDWSELLFLSFQLAKDEKSRPSCLAC